MKHIKYVLPVLLAFCGILLSGDNAMAQFTTEKAIDTTSIESVEEQRMKLLVTDYKTKKSLEADVMIKGLNPRKTVVLKNLTDTTLLIKNYRLYTVSVVKQGYMYFAHKFWPDEASFHMERVELKPLALGLKTNVDDITFQGDETQIYHKSVPALQELIDFLNVNPNVKICIIGHANGPISDKQKSESFYRKATEKRAEAVRDYLIQHGIKAERLTTKGLGNTQMIYPDPQTDWQIDANRRIEIEITGL